MNRLELVSPAKLNLFLHINGRLPGGYHALQTIFQLLDYGDTLRFTLTPEKEIRLNCSWEELNNDDNLVIRAARQLQAMSSGKQGVSIDLDKCIPMGAGLGGGSSNAATTLLALNRLWRLNLSRQCLLEIACELGADIPVFVAGHSSWAEGRGEILIPLTLTERWYVVLTPPCRVSTAEIFSHEQLTRNTPPLKIPAFPILGCKNDCEWVASRLYPEIRKALDWLNQRGQASMTGTGAGVFAAYDSKEQALAQLSDLPAGLSGFVARGVNRSPVHFALKEEDWS